MMTHELYPVRFAEMEVKGDANKLVAYLEKNAEHLQTEYGVLRARICKEERDTHNVRVEFPVCEIDSKAYDKLIAMRKEIEAEGLRADFISTIKSDMVGAESFPYEDVGDKIWKLHGQQKKAYDARIFRFEKLENE